MYYSRNVGLDYKQSVIVVTCFNVFYEFFSWRKYAQFV